MGSLSFGKRVEPSQMRRKLSRCKKKSVFLNRNRQGLKSDKPAESRILVTFDQLTDVCLNRISIDVFISVLIVVKRADPRTKYSSPVDVVDPLGFKSENPARFAHEIVHSLAKIRLRKTRDKVEVVVHQHEGVNFHSVSMMDKP